MKTLDETVHSLLLCGGELFPDGDESFVCDICSYVGEYVDEHYAVEID